MFIGFEWTDNQINLAQMTPFCLNVWFLARITFKSKVWLCEANTTLFCLTDRAHKWTTGRMWWDVYHDRPLILTVPQGSFLFMTTGWPFLRYTVLTFPRSFTHPSLLFKARTICPYQFITPFDCLCLNCAWLPFVFRLYYFQLKDSSPKN